MKNKNIIAVIDLGTVNLKCAIYSLAEGLPKLVGFSKKKTRGIHNSIIINLSHAIDSVRSCLAEAEKKSEINLEKINVLIDPVKTITTKLTKYKKVSGSKIEKDDISFLLKEAKKQVESNDSRISHIHIFNNKYVVDNNTFKNLPVNTYADNFSQENVFLGVPKNILKNISEVFHSCDIEIDKFIFSPYASGVYCFNQDQIDYGCGIVDVGYEKTSLALFKDSSLIHATSFPIGSNHITKDISRGCYLSEAESEIIKKDISILKHPDKSQFLKENYFLESKFRKISLKFVKDVILARVDEILNKVFKEINLLLVNGTNFYLIFTGNGSTLKDFKKIAEGKLSNKIIDLETEESSKIDIEFLSCYGAVKIMTEGFASEAIAVTDSNKAGKKLFFTRIFDIFS